MVEMTLEDFNALLAQANISEFSKDKVYLIALDSNCVSQHDAMEMIKWLASKGVQCVAAFGRGKDAIKAFTLPDSVIGKTQ